MAEVGRTTIKREDDGQIIAVAERLSLAPGDKIGLQRGDRLHIFEVVDIEAGSHIIRVREGLEERL